MIYDNQLGQNPFRSQQRFRSHIYLYQFTFLFYQLNDLEHEWLNISVKSIAE